MKDKIVLGLLFLTTIFGTIISFLPAGNIYDQQRVAPSLIDRETATDLVVATKGLTVYFYNYHYAASLAVLALILLGLLFIGLLVSGKKMQEFTVAFVFLFAIYTFGNLSFQISLSSIEENFAQQFEWLWPFHAMGNINFILLGFLVYLFYTRKQRTAVMKDRIVLGLLFLTTVFGTIVSFLPAGIVYEEQAIDTSTSPPELMNPLRVIEQESLTVYFYNHHSETSLAVFALIVLGLFFLGLLISGRKMQKFTIVFILLIAIYTFGNLSFQMSFNGIGNYLPGRFDRLWPFHTMGNINYILLGLLVYLFFTRKKRKITDEAILDENFEAQ